MTKIIVDVRELTEYEGRHVEGAVNVPLSKIMASDYGNLPKEAELVLYCNSGNRSGVALKILEAAGYKNVVNGINQRTVEETLNT